MAKLLSKALSCVTIVFFWLSFMATSVTARLMANVTEPVSSAVQEPLLTDELVALQEIAKALSRSVKLVTKNWSWIKVALFTFGGSVIIEIVKIFTGVLTQYLVDLWMPQRDSPMHPTLENPLAAYAIEVADLQAQLAAALNEVANLRAQLAPALNEVADLRAQLAVALSEVTDLWAQLAAALNLMATTTADASRRQEETNRKVDWLEERFKCLDPNRRDNSSFWPRVETEQVQGSEGSSH